MYLSGLYCTIAQLGEKDRTLGESDKERECMHFSGFRDCYSSCIEKY